MQVPNQAFRLYKSKILPFWAFDHRAQATRFPLFTDILKTLRISRRWRLSKDVPSLGCHLNDALTGANRLIGARRLALRPRSDTMLIRRTTTFFKDNITHWLAFPIVSLTPFYSFHRKPYTTIQYWILVIFCVFTIRSLIPLPLWASISLARTAGEEQICKSQKRVVNFEVRKHWYSSEWFPVSNA